MKLVTAMVIVLALAACGSSAHKAATPPSTASTTSSSAPEAKATTTTTAVAINYGRQYTSIVAPVNAAEAALNPNATSAPQLASALDTAAHALNRDSWPAKASGDIKALAAEMLTLSSDVKYNMAAVTADAGKLKGLIDAARADLGLEPAQ